MDFSECLGTERLTKTYTRLGSLYQCTEQTSYKIGDVACSLPLLKLFGESRFIPCPRGYDDILTLISLLVKEKCSH